MASLKSIGEFGLIEQIQKKVSVTPSVYKGIGDDTAVVSLSSRKKGLMTTDMLIEGVHFKRSMPWADIGHKAIACSLSDIAAMGGVPKYALVSLGVSPNESPANIQQLYKGMQKTARKFKTAIVGGDIVRSAKTIINVALFGEVLNKNLVLRSGAKANDWIFVTGTLGRSFQTGKHLTFTPRLAMANFLTQRCKPRAMIDVSDGLAADLGHVLKASQCGAKIFKDKIPCTKSANIKHALYDGEDFELLFTVSAKQGEALSRMRRPYRFFHIGEMTRQRSCLLVDEHGKSEKLTLKGFKHF